MRVHRVMPEGGALGGESAAHLVSLQWRVAGQGGAVVVRYGGVAVGRTTPLVLRTFLLNVAHLWFLPCTDL